MSFLDGRPPGSIPWQAHGCLGISSCAGRGPFCRQPPTGPGRPAARTGAVAEARRGVDVTGCGGGRVWRLDRARRGGRGTGSVGVSPACGALTCRNESTAHEVIPSSVGSISAASQARIGEVGPARREERPAPRLDRERAGRIGGRHSVEVGDSGTMAPRPRPESSPAGQRTGVVRVDLECACDVGGGTSRIARLRPRGRVKVQRARTSSART